MELLDRYLEAVKACLPAAQRDDIAQEISANILAQMDEREAALGRLLTGDEQAEILKAFGHPRIVASRYYPPPQLIGPELLPFYWHAMKFALLIGVAFAFVAATVNGIARGDMLAEAGIAWGSFWSVIFAIFGIVTLVFAGIQYFQTRLGHRLEDAGFTKWDPRKLPAVKVDDRLNRLSLTTEVFFGVLFLTWLGNIFGVREVLFNHFSAPGAHATVFWPFLPAQVWFQATAAIWLLTLSSVIVSVINLFRPDWTSLHAIARIVVNVGLIGVCAYIARAHPLVLLADPSHQTARIFTAAAVLEAGARWSLVVVAATTALDAFVNLRRIWPRARVALTRTQNGAARS